MEHLKLDKIRVRFESGENPTNLMNEMEQVFKIPALNDPTYNEDHQAVIRLYREISLSRDI